MISTGFQRVSACACCGTSSATLVSEKVVNKALIAGLGILTTCVLAEAFYVPRFRQAALDAAYSDYSGCVRNLPQIFCAPQPCRFHVPTEADCAGAYLNRREAIMAIFLFPDPRKASMRRLSAEQQP